MTTAISNVNAIWVDANAKVGLGFNAVDIGQNTSSRLLKLSANGNSMFEVLTTGTFKSFVYTVPNLPAASSVGSGARAFVSDCNNRTFYSRVFTGGSNAVPVFSNGTYWLVG
jgi:hypothetical protein